MAEYKYIEGMEPAAQTAQEEATEDLVFGPERPRLWLVRDEVRHGLGHRIIASLAEPVWSNGAWWHPHPGAYADLWHYMESRRVAELFGLEPLMPGECVEVTITGARVGEVRRAPETRGT